MKGSPFNLLFLWQSAFKMGIGGFAPPSYINPLGPPALLAFSHKEIGRLWPTSTKQWWGKSSPHTIIIKRQSAASSSAISPINFLFRLSAKSILWLSCRSPTFENYFPQSSHHPLIIFHEELHQLKAPLDSWARLDFLVYPQLQDHQSNSEQIVALLFINEKKEIGIIYRPTPVVSTDGKLVLGIIGNMLEEGSTPTIIKNWWQGSWLVLHHPKLQGDPRDLFPLNPPPSRNGEGHWVGGGD